MTNPGEFPEVVCDEVRKFGAELLADSHDELRIEVGAETAFALLTHVRNQSNLALRRLVDLTAIDREADPRRFEVVYRLHSPSLNERVRVHVGIGVESPSLDSVVSLWPSANWLEREVFDLFGIEFLGHPDLRRILLDSDFEGAPLRKDYLRQPGLGLPKEAAF
jgi:NADH-quinone oxidoreductase subunit C